MAKMTIDEARAEQATLEARLAEINKQITQLQTEGGDVNARYIHLNGYIDAMSPDVEVATNGEGHVVELVTEPSG